MRRRGRASASLQAPRGCCALLHREASEVYEVAECGGSSHAAAARLIVVAFKGPRGLLAQGTPLHVASEILGHASITITKDVYGHLVEGDRRAVAASMSQALFGPGSAVVAPNMAPNGTEKAPPQGG